MTQFSRVRGIYFSRKLLVLFVLKWTLETRLGAEIKTGLILLAAADLRGTNIFRKLCDDQAKKLGE